MGAICGVCGKAAMYTVSKAGIEDVCEDCICYAMTITSDHWREVMYSKADVTLNGHPARITGWQNEVATLSYIQAHPFVPNAWHWSWEQVACVVSRGGRFNTESTYFPRIDKYIKLPTLVRRLHKNGRTAKVYNSTDAIVDHAALERLAIITVYERQDGKADTLFTFFDCEYSATFESYDDAVWFIEHAPFSATGHYTVERERVEPHNTLQTRFNYW